VRNRLADERPRRLEGVRRTWATHRAKEANTLTTFRDLGILSSIADALERVGISEKADAYPADLSGGQQQRVAIARALAMEPKLMLFDEPTSALDPEMIREVLDVMRQLARDGMTMIVVTHEMGFAREVCDRIVFIDDGQIVEEGPPDEFFSSARSPRAKEFVDKIIHH
jgi:ABC-type polar amino acid transport system ATPase subunit